MAINRDALSNISVGELAKKIEEINQQRKSELALLKMEPIAIIGMACRFPGSNNTDDFWKLLCSDKLTSVEIPPSRFESNLFKDKMSEFKKPLSYKGNFLLEGELESFDYDFFKISPREVKNMDPQQRLLLKVSWEALESACLVPDAESMRKVGVYVGSSEAEFRQVQFSRFETIEGYCGTGGNSSVIPGRVSYFLNAKGPSFNVDTACSSSLVALHLACQSLKNHETDVCLAAGVGVLVAPGLFMAFGKAGMLAPDGLCKAFDASADGYARGEGCGVLVLKRLSDAIRDRDRVLAVIRGTGVNHVGQSAGLTVPSQSAQEDLMRQVLRESGVSAEKICYIEAHGTGTSIGDPIEAAAIGNVYGKSNRSKGNPLPIGSVKTNIGHLEATSGLAGVIKAILCLRNKEIPVSKHITKPNPAIDFEGLNIKVVTEPQAIDFSSSSALIGINSFGFGGTNGHVIVESYPENVIKNDIEAPVKVLTISAKSYISLKKLTEKYSNYLKTTACTLEDITFSSNIGRSHFRFRKSFAYENKEDLLRQINSFDFDQKKTTAPSDVISIEVMLNADDLSLNSSIYQLLNKFSFSSKAGLSEENKIKMFFESIFKVRAGMQLNFKIENAPRQNKIQIHVGLSNKQILQINLDLLAVKSDPILGFSSFISQAYEAGINLNWSYLYQNYNFHKLELPLYAFDETKFELPKFRVCTSDTNYGSGVSHDVPTENSRAVILTEKDKKWFSIPKPNSNAKLKLFCFSYAGGSSEIYRRWSAILSKDIELYIVTLPGRDHRIAEPPILEFDVLINDLSKAIEPLVERSCFSFYGHSMGGLIAFELARKLYLSKNIKPEFLVLGASLPPQDYVNLFSQNGRRTPISVKSDNAFLEELKKWGGGPGAIDSQVADIKKALPILRADFMVLEGYNYDNAGPIPVKIVVLAADGDNLSLNTMHKWGQLTNRDFEVIEVKKAGHFFVNTNWELIVDKINNLWELKSNSPRCQRKFR